MCGYYASGWEYDTSVMVAIIDNNLSTNSVDMLPPDVIIAEETWACASSTNNTAYVMSRR